MLKAPKIIKKITKPKFRSVVARVIYFILNNIPIVIIPGLSKKSLTIYHLIKQATYKSDGFLTTHHVGFFDDSKFITSYNNAWINVPSVYWKNDDIKWRAHICCWAASRAIHLDGDFIELGVWYGVLSKTICEYVSFEKMDKNFYLVDAFGKMPGSHTNKNYENDIFQIVKERFLIYPNVKFIRGLVPEILEKIPSQRVAYLSIDMNGSEPERAALEYYYDKLVPGGIIYFDDYGWEYPDLRKVISTFLEGKPEKLLHFPSGNSILIKI